MKLKLVAFLTLIVNSSFAQFTITNYDINPGSSGSVPYLLTPFNNKLYFYADDGTHGRELMVVDTSGTASLVADIYSGATASCPTHYQNEKMAVINNTSSGSALFFQANNGTTGAELYQYTGTGAPTLVKDINPGSSGSTPAYFASANNKVYFKDTYGGENIWEYDPTTSIARALTKYQASNQPAGISRLFSFNNKVFCVASAGGFGQELLKYDPTTDSVTLVSDINSGSAGSFPDHFTPANGKLYFAATSTTYGREIYEYNDATGTVSRMTDLNPGTAHTVSIGGNWLMSQKNNVIYFYGSSPSANLQLMKYDVITNTASLAATINTTAQAQVDAIENYKNRMFFKATDGTSASVLWMYDGYSAPIMVKDGSGNTINNPSELTVMNGCLFMLASIASMGAELVKLKDNSTGIEPINNFKNSFSIALNPSNGILQLNLNDNYENATVTVIDLTGKIMYEKRANEKMIRVDMSAYAKGTYLVTMKCVSGTETQKLVLE